jgi:hypothetical protein
MAGGSPCSVGTQFVLSWPGRHSWSSTSPSTVMNAMTRPRSKPYQLRLTPDEVERWREGAWRRRLPLSVMIRNAVEADLERVDVPEPPPPGGSLEEALAELGIEL